MKTGELIDGIERFVLDVVGTIVPGTILIIGWAMLFGIPSLPGIGRFMPLPQEMDIWLFVVLGYILGHVVTSVGTVLINPGPIVRFMRKHPVSARLVAVFRSDSEVATDLTTKQTYQSFVQRASAVMPWLGSIGVNQVHDWRSIAMSLLSPQENHTVYRFMFISLLNLGTASAVIMLGIAWIFAKGATQARSWRPWSSLLFPECRDIDWSVVAVGIVTCLILFERHSAFYSRALRVPFTMGIVKLVDNPAILPATSVSHGRSIYLAGGTRSNWQETVTAALSDWRIVDPRVHHLEDERAYTTWDLEGIKGCDWMLAYLEESNPGGYNLAFEIGYAKALGKKVILVDTKSAKDEAIRRYTGMLHASADVKANRLEDALEFLDGLPTRG